MKYKYIAIEGNIGAGKSTFAELLAKELDARAVYEEFAENPFLPKFYADKERYAFTVELSFLADRYQQLNSMLLVPDLFRENVVADYALFKSLLFAQITLNKDEFKLFRNLFQIMHANLPKPDLLIYLHLGLDKLKENIISRGRSYEQNISKAYLDQIHQAYMGYLRLQNNMRILMVDISNLDFVGSEQDRKFLVDLTKKEWKTGINFVQENYSFSGI